MARNIEINFKSGENQYEVLYPVTLTGNITDLESYLSSRYYSKSEIDSFNLQFGRIELGTLSLPAANPRNRVLISSPTGSVGNVKGAAFEFEVYGTGKRYRSIGFYLQGLNWVYGISFLGNTPGLGLIRTGYFEDYIYIEVSSFSESQGMTLQSQNSRALLFY